MNHMSATNKTLTQTGVELLSSLPGDWTVRVKNSLTRFSEFDVLQFQDLLPFPDCDGTAIYRELPGGIIEGTYALSVRDSGPSKPLPPWQFLFKANPSQKYAAAVFSDEPSAADNRGVWARGRLCFVSGFQANCVLWKLLAACLPGIPCYP
jgi:hypothetical protein